VGYLFFLGGLRILLSRVFCVFPLTSDLSWELPYVWVPTYIRPYSAINTPETKKGDYFCTIFEGFVPQESAANCVPSGKSIACSTVEALEWDASFKDNAAPSGRAMQDVHNNACMLIV